MQLLGREDALNGDKTNRIAGEFIFIPVFTLWYHRLGCEEAGRTKSREVRDTVVVDYCCSQTNVSPHSRYPHSLLANTVLHCYTLG